MRVGAVRVVPRHGASPEREADDAVGDEHHRERQDVDEGDHCEMVPGGRAKGLGTGGPGGDFLSPLGLAGAPEPPRSRPRRTTLGGLPRP